ncbi:hypothetical protein [Pseudoxanthomonas sp.]|uniref:hypothetical protein n=1 Tax=Pseudoxanthomonas sp. TaxID=1871049 RepID=UPI0028C42A76|nr:hypothetical protein [Pseudoxanthomonas sp.]
MTAPSLLVAVLALSPGADNRFPHTVPPLEVSPDPIGDCARWRLKPFVNPYGIQQVWPLVEAPSQELMLAQERPLSDTGQVADGYAHFVHIDAAARAVYVIEQGGFAGTTKVYGPLPLPRCTPSIETPQR